MERRDFIVGGLGALAVVVSPWSLYAGQKEIRIVYTKTFVPMSYANSDDRMTGFYVDLFEEILGRQMGFKVSYLGLPWKRAQLEVRQGRAEAFCMNATPTRRAYLNYCDEMVIESRKAVIFHPDSDLSKGSQDPIPLEELRQFPHLNYLGNGWIKSNFKGVDIYWVRERRLVLKMIASGRPGILVTGELGVRHTIRQMGLPDQLRLRPVKIAKK